MKKIVILNGPNLNLLGNREQEIYGTNTLGNIEKECINKCLKFKLECNFFQNNNEGDIINHIHSAQDNYDGLIINPAAFTHTSIALLDALRALNKPKIEVHLSNIHTREDFRKNSITSQGVDGSICGFGTLSYILAIEALNKLIYK
jgi:3-dehydroquinate dehydratase-2